MFNIYGTILSLVVATEDSWQSEWYESPDILLVSVINQIDATIGI